MENPAQLRIGAFERDSGEIIYYKKDDIHDITDLMNISLVLNNAAAFTHCDTTYLMNYIAIICFYINYLLFELINCLFN